MKSMLLRKRQGLLVMVASALLFVGAGSCKKSSGGGAPAQATKSVSIKITLNPATINTGQGSSFGGAVNALLPNASLATWKVNGVTRTDETTISFTQTDFKNGVLTLETTANVTSANLTIDGVTVSTPFTVLVEPTINGQAGNSSNISVTSTMQRSFTY